MNASATINHSALRRDERAPRYAFGMDKDTFVRKAAKRSGFTVEEYEQYFAVTPCECGKRKCKGWQVRWKFGAERRREGNA